MTPIEAYQTIDGKQFFSEEEGHAHEGRILLETAKCRIFTAYAKAITEEQQYYLVQAIAENEDLEATIGDFDEVAELIIEIAKFDKEAFLKLADEIRKTNLKTYDKDYKLGIKKGFIEVQVKEVNEDEVEYADSEAEIEEE